MNFPMLQMLAEGKKKKDDAGDADMDFDLDMSAVKSSGKGGMSDGKGGASTGKGGSASSGKGGMSDGKGGAPAKKAKGDDDKVVGKAQILSALPDLTAAERKAILKKVTALVAADDEE